MIPLETITTTIRMTAYAFVIVTGFFALKYGTRNAKKLLIGDMVFAFLSLLSAVHYLFRGEVLLAFIITPAVVFWAIMHILSFVEGKKNC